MRKIRLFFRRMCIVVTFILIITIFINNMQLKLLYKTDYSEYVEKYSSMYNIDEKLVYAVIKNESNFDSKAISRVGAKGLMQIMDSTAEDVAKELNLEEYNLLVPEDNIKIGIKYLSDLIQKYGETSLALAAYNAGFGTVDTWIADGVISADGNDYENIPYKETNMYVRKILRDYNIYVTKIS